MITDHERKKTPIDSIRCHPTKRGVAWSSRPRSTGKWPSAARSLDGFTLAEMLLVVSLISILSIAVFRSLANGMRIWERSLYFYQEEDVALFLDRFAQDLHNAFDYSSSPFEGSQDRISFFTHVRTPMDKKISSNGDLIEQLGRVEYVFNKTQNSLYRKQANYGQAVKQKFGRSRLLAKSIQSLKFLYYVEDNKIMQEKSEWSGSLPSAVRGSMDVLESSGQRRRISRLVNIPVKGPSSR